MILPIKIEDLRPGDIIEWSNDHVNLPIYGIVLKINDGSVKKNVITVLVEGKIETTSWFLKHESVHRLAITEKNQGRQNSSR